VRDLALLFLKLGTIGFGGPAAHIALMEDEVVRRRGWLTREAFLDLVGASALIPGPNSTELAIHIGYRRAGVPGLLIAGACFIFPAVIIVTAIAWASVQAGDMPPTAGAMLHGIHAVIIAIVLQALVGLARTAVTNAYLACIGAAAVVAAVSGVHELAVLAGGAVLGALPRLASGRDARTGALLAVSAGAAATAAVVPVTVTSIFLVFLKIGSVLFGSGYVLLAFLRTDLVLARGWLTESQLLNAIAVGQVTPGPVFTTATFVGYLLAGMPGAAAATAGIFLPAFAFVAITAPFISRLRRSRIAAGLLDGVNVASLALMALVTWQLGRAALTDLRALAVAGAAAIALLRFRVNATWVIAAGAVAGWLLW
jgi:chromate transporter